ncbi:hypothetical protein ACVVIH_12955 [Chryseobacterium arthrosphaerae]
MKTKYIKVSVSDRLPDDNVDVIMIDEFGVVGEGKRSGDNWWSYGAVLEGSIEYWLQEVPDYEDEMKEMLSKCMLEFGRFKAELGQGSKLELEIKSILTKLKTES